jgi:F-type H+-transporting ATPase subunit epsilon
LRLTVTTTLATIAEACDVVHLRAEDETGAFGILPGHADFVTALTVSVATWRDAKGAEHHAAVRGGMLQVEGGQAITIATREAITSDDLHRLETEVIAAFHRKNEEERAASTDAHRLYLAAIRQICRFLKSEREPSVPRMPGAAFREGAEQ